MMKLLFALFFSASLLAQTKVIDVKIDAITSDDSNPKKRNYTITYHIENLTDSPVSFFLRPKTLIANAVSSMTLYPIYKIYQNGHFTPLDGPFHEREDNENWNTYLQMSDKNTPEAKVLLEKILADYAVEKKKILDDYKKSGGKSTDEIWILKNHQLLQSKITLQPKETRSFRIETSWNKERYFLQDDLEYYLDEKDAYALELTLHLIKKDFKDQLSVEEFSKIEKDEHFIEGIFVSDKVGIDFGI